MRVRHHDYLNWINSPPMPDDQVQEAKRIRKEGAQDIGDVMLLELYEYECMMHAYDAYVNACIDERKESK